MKKSLVGIERFESKIQSSHNELYKIKDKIKSLDGHCNVLKKENAELKRLIE